jgi:hypothetical protein
VLERNFCVTVFKIYFEGGIRAWVVLVGGGCGFDDDKCNNPLYFSGYCGIRRLENGS